MSDNGSWGRIPRTLITHDLVSGEDLFIVYFPKEDLVTINGYSVTQSLGHEGSEGQSIFHRGPDNKVYTVAADRTATLFL